MRFTVEMDIDINDKDADLMRFFPEAVQDRFAGTAIRISRIEIKKTEEQS